MGPFGQLESDVLVTFSSIVLKKPISQNISSHAVRKKKLPRWSKIFMYAVRLRDGILTGAEERRPEDLDLDTQGGEL